ncbi:hypothetical protein [Renibacterium salmoninarum]|nr:hypothetical protein [Renibacterium salmoninarum]
MGEVSRRKVIAGITGVAAVGALSWAGAAPATASQPCQQDGKVLALNAWYGGKGVAAVA